MKALEFMWAGGNTRRFHTVPTILTDTVGHHSYNVACIIMYLRPQASTALLRAALKHDVAEHVLGDMPAPAKRKLPGYVNGPTAESFREVFGKLEDKESSDAGVPVELLTSEEEWLLKFADAFDGLRFCYQEFYMGNKIIVPALENFRAYTEEVLKLPHAQPGAKELLHSFLIGTERGYIY